MAEPEQQAPQEATAAAHAPLQVGDLCPDPVLLSVVGRRVELLLQVAKVRTLGRPGIHDVRH